MRILAAAGVLALLSSSAFAQQSANPQVPTDKASYMSAADLAAAIAKGPTERPNSTTRVFSLAPYNVNVEKRQPVAQGASAHDATAELFHVLEGSGVMLTGGTIPNATRNGTNLQGKTIEGRHAPGAQQGRLADRARRRAPSVRRHQGQPHDHVAASAEAVVLDSKVLGST